MKVLLVEDDPDIVESISLTMQVRWPETEFMSTHLGHRGIELAKTEDFDLIILDLGLPDINGFEVLRSIRRSCSVPVIILTVRSEEGDIVKGLEWGADDYIIKPCGQLEFLARVRARIRDRFEPVSQKSISFGPLRLDPTTYEVLCGERKISLTAIESRILRKMMSNNGYVVTYSILAEDVWGEDSPGFIESLRVHIRRLREKLEVDPGNPQMILTKSGVGYFLARP